MVHHVYMDSRAAMVTAGNASVSIDRSLCVQTSALDRLIPICLLGFKVFRLQLGMKGLQFQTSRSG